MQTAEKAYLFGGAGVVLSRGLSLFAGVASLWILSQILTTEQFAGYSVAMSVVFLVGFTAGLGLERSMVLRIGELKPSPATLRGRTMMLRIAFISLGLGIIAMLVAIGVSYGAQGNWRLSFIGWLSPVIPATTITFVLINWYQANHIVGISQSMIGLVDILRCLFFAICMILGLTIGWIAVAAIVAAASPILILSLRARGRTQNEPDAVTLKDARDGLQFFIMRLATMGFYHFDILALGMLGTGTGTAQYAVASRFAILIETPQVVFAPTFAPRVRRHLAEGDIDLASREYHVARVIGFSGALAMTLIFLLFGRWILSFFGELGGGFQPFVIIAAAYVSTVGFGMHSVFLSMSNGLAVSTLNRAVSAVIFILFLTILIPRYDAMGAAFALLAATAIHNAVGVVALKRIVGIAAFKLRELLFTLLAVAALIWTGIEPGMVPFAAVFIAMLLALTLWLEWHILAKLLSRISRALAPSAD